MLLWVGLGNPEPGMARHRHNIGFMAVDVIARRHGFSPWRQRFKGFSSEGMVGSQKILLLRPMTYMNLSGEAVQAAAGFYKIPPAAITVFHDELDLAPGRFRMKAGGGAAGHNGLRSISGRIGPDYRRARLGIGHPGHKDLVLNYVLADFYKVEEPWVEALDRACADAAPMLAEGEDLKYQSEVSRLAPAEKLDARSASRERLGR